MMQCPHCRRNIGNATKVCPCGHTQISVIRQYFIDRAKELVSLASGGAVWPFICCSTFIEYMAKMSVDPTTVRQRRNAYGTQHPTDDGVYVTFINQYFPAKYNNFHYTNQMLVNEPFFGGRINVRTDKCLPYKMYSVLRCGLVHGFSLIDDKSPMSFPRSIFIEHRGESQSQHLEHKSDAQHDAALFISEDFAQDILKVTKELFNKAKNDMVLKKRIVEYYHNKPPVQAL